MNDWIAEDENDYVLKAIKKTSNLDELFQIKKQLRNKFLKSPLSDVIEYTKQFENSLDLIWQTYLEKNNKT